MRPAGLVQRAEVEVGEQEDARDRHPDDRDPQPEQEGLEGRGSPRSHGTARPDPRPGRTIATAAVTNERSSRTWRRRGWLSSHGPTVCNSGMVGRSVEMVILVRGTNGGLRVCRRSGANAMLRSSLDLTGGWGQRAQVGRRFGSRVPSLVLVLVLATGTGWVPARSDPVARGARPWGLKFGARMAVRPVSHGVGGPSLAAPAERSDDVVSPFARAETTIDPGPDPASGQDRTQRRDRPRTDQCPRARTPTDRARRARCRRPGADRRPDPA